MAIAYLCHDDIIHLLWIKLIALSNSTTIANYVKIETGQNFLAVPAIKKVTSTA